MTGMTRDSANRYARQPMCIEEEKAKKIATALEIPMDELFERIYLKKYRRLRGLTQQELGELADMSVHEIEEYEQGRRYPDELRLAKLAQALCMPVRYLLKNKGYMDSQPCWTCRHIGDGSCMWAYEKESIGGWRTHKKTVKDGKRKIEQTVIDYCPNYAAEEKA